MCVFFFFVTLHAKEYTETKRMKKTSLLACLAAFGLGAYADSNYALGITADNVLVGGEKTNISLNLKSITPITLIQADLVLPEGVTVEADSNKVMPIVAGTRTDGHVVNANTLTNGNVRILLYSDSNNTFADSEGNVAGITLSVAPNIAEGTKEIRLTNILLVEPDETSYRPEDAAIELSSIDQETAIKNIGGNATDYDAVYNTAGQRTGKNAKSIQVRKGKKTMK